MESNPLTFAKLYNVEFREEYNAIVENLDNYLAFRPSQKISREFYIKTFPINLTTRIAYEGAEAFNNRSYNYLLLNAVIDGVNRPYYYFIRSLKWVANNTLEIEAVMDTLNTFSELYSYISPLTYVYREHRDRFRTVEKVSTTEFKALANIDLVDEGDNVKLVNNLRTQLMQDNAPGGSTNEWYLVYLTEAYSSTNPDDVTPLLCYIVPKKSFTITRQVRRSGSLDQIDFLKGKRFMFNTSVAFQSTITFTLEGEADPYSVPLNNRAGSYIEVYVDAWDPGFSDSEYSYTRIYGIKQNADGSTSQKTLKNIFQKRLLKIKYTNLAGYYDAPYKSEVYTFHDLKPYDTTATQSINSIYTIDRTDPRTIAIISLPYCPFHLVNGHLPLDYVINGLGYIEKSDTITPFSSIAITTIDLSSILKVDYRFNTISDKAYITDPKIYNSKYYYIKLLYDTFSGVIKPETIANISNNFDDPVSFNITFQPTNTTTSTILFRYTPSFPLIYPIDNDTDYPTYFISKRNNNELILNSKYLDYVRYGYNYDAMKVPVAILGGLATSIMGLATGNYGVGAGGLFGGILSGIYQGLDLDKQLETLRQQALSVQSGEAVDLLKAYGGNKLNRLTYQVEDYVKESLLARFRYTGYATNYMKLPDIHSRLWYNFLQANIVFTASAPVVYEPYLSNIQAKFKSGVTFFHAVGQNYNFNRDFENLEISIYNKLTGTN